MQYGVRVHNQEEGQGWRGHGQEEKAQGHWRWRCRRRYDIPLPLIRHLLSVSTTLAHSHAHTIAMADTRPDTLPIRPKPAKVAKRAAICVPLPESTVAAAYSPPSALELVLVQRPRLRAGRAPLLFWETADGLQLDIAARYPSLGKCRLFTKESFALLEAFESKLAVSEYSRFCCKLLRLLFGFWHC